ELMFKFGSKTLVMAFECVVYLVEIRKHQLKKAREISLEPFRSCSWGIIMDIIKLTLLGTPPGRDKTPM
ncbi:hypothetical protein, partial [Paenibacillus whitsoniae]|uniref:hypothetical protein n=1 Tax=Paenibacillus whitsoniae TaxID=2496558 RepID=UPI0019D29467